MHYIILIIILTYPIFVYIDLMVILLEFVKNNEVTLDFNLFMSQYDLMHIQMYVITNVLSISFKLCSFKSDADKVYDQPSLNHHFHLLSMMIYQFNF